MNLLTTALIVSSEKIGLNMKPITTYIRQKIPTLTFLICILSVPFYGLAIEPIATIGHPQPLKQVFLNNETILRVVPTHFQIVDVDTYTVISEFGSLLENSKIEFSPKASLVAIFNYSSSTGKTHVEIWDVKSKQNISNWDIELGNYENAAFSPIAQVLAIHSNDEIHLWNWKNGEFLGMMAGERRPSEPCYNFGNGGWICGGNSHGRMVFTQDGEHLIVASNRSDIELWNVDSRELVGHFQGHAGEWVEGIVISPNRKLLASFEKSNFVYVWDMESRQLQWKWKSSVAQISDIVFSPDSQRLYVASKTGGLSKSGAAPWRGWEDNVRIWDINTGQVINTIGTKFRKLDGLTISPDGNKLLMHYIDGEVIWDIENDRHYKTWTDFVRYWSFNDVELSPDGKTVVSVSDHFIKIWDIDTKQIRFTIPAEDYIFEKVTISPDSQKFAIGKDPWVQIRDIHTGEVVRQFEHFVAGVNQITYSQTGRWIAAVDDFGTVVIIDIDHPERIQRIDGRIFPFGSTRFRQIAFSKDDNYLAVTGGTRINNDEKHLIYVWKQIAGAYVQLYTTLAPKLYSSPSFTTLKDGTLVLACPGGKEGIKIWKIMQEHPELLTTLDESSLGAIQFSQEGRYLFVNREDDLLIWDWQANRPIKGSLITRIPGFLSLSYDSSLLSYDRTGNYQIWEIKDVLSFLPYSVEPQGKLFSTFGQIKHTQLLQNFPNPFNPETWIPFRLADESDVTIDIYSLTGRLVRTISPGKMAAGEYTSQSKAVYWDGRNNNGESISSGVYLYTINAGDFSATRKLLIQK